MKKLVSQNASKDGRRSTDSDSSDDHAHGETILQTQKIQQPVRPADSHASIAPSTSSSMQTVDDVYSPNQQKTISTSSSDSKVTPEFTSPTKSLKTFLFKNRLSSYSIDSISEEPELEPQAAKEQKTPVTSPGGHDLTPTRSPNRLLNFNLRPKFIRSRSSGLSDANPPPTPSRLTPSSKKRVTLDDFADTDSDDSGVSPRKEGEGDSGDMGSPILFDETFDESVNSVLQEYHNRDSDLRTRSMFVESDLRPKSGEISLDESEQLKSDIIRQGSVRSIGSRTTHTTEAVPSDKQKLFIDAKESQEQFKHGTVKAGQPSPTVFKRLSGPSDESSPKTPKSDRESTGSSTSLRFKVHGDQIEPVKNKARHISSAANVTRTDTNRSSLRASIAASDDSEADDSSRSKYPDPTITPLATPRVHYAGNRNSSSTDYTNRSSINDSAIAGSLPNTSSSGGGSGGSRQQQVHPPMLRHSLADDSISLGGDEYNLEEEETIDSRTKALNFSNTTHMFDETMLKSEDTKHSSMAHSSMSSGELLKNLVGGSYDHTRSSDNSDAQRPGSQYREGGLGSRPGSTLVSPSKGITTVPEGYSNAPSDKIYPNLPPKQRLPRSESNQTVNNMTAGLDASNELPIMLYTIHNKDYDESKNRWSVYENRNSQNSAREREGAALSPHSASGSNSPDPNEVLASKPLESHVGSVSGSSGIGSRSAARMSNASSTLSRYQTIDDPRFDNHPTKFTQPDVHGQRQEDAQLPGQHLVLSQPKRNLFLNDRQPSSNMIDAEKEIHDFTYKTPQDQTHFARQEKQEVTHESTYKFLPYTWLQFSLLMVVGLVAPPIYFLITAGLFDGRDGPGSYYGAMTGYKVNHSNQGVYVKRFTKSQKITSFVIGLVWVLIVLAMIGVGLGVGLTKGR
ncbi:hypothetical protein I9W82_000991 [Candida metapsilosis]|uniref:Uncharacterized protein n=1 Tax=Candida metapsilosis TaxID=273372 RepID=A0A8H8DCT8_9ASCO|nr:hypothetical protein I9W82_000991 [Candida metapsilosis]